MTNKERVLAACAHRKPDRVPVDVWFRDDVREKFMKYMDVTSVEALYKKLDVDLRSIWIGFDNPAYEAKTNGVLGDHVELTGGRFIFHENGVFEDMWGVLQKNGKDGLYTQWIGGPFADSEDIEDYKAYPWPSMDIVPSQEVINAKVASVKALGDYAIRGSVSNPFKQAWQMRGYENTLCDMLLNPEMVSYVLNRIADYYIEVGIRLVKAGVDILGVVGDIASQKSLIFSPEVFKTILKPVLKRMTDAFRKENPDILLFFHSDGDVTQAMEDLIDCGFTIINPIQPECMDLAETKRRFGDRITMHGTISLQQLLPFGTITEIHTEVGKIIETCGQNGGLIISPSNLIQNDTPMENILALYEAAEGKKLR